MNIVYFSPYDILRPRTNQVSDIRFCEAFVENNCHVNLFVPQVEREDNLDKTNILSFYDVGSEFEISYHEQVFKDENLSKSQYLKMSLVNLFLLLKLSKKNKQEDYYVISRSETLLFFTLIFKKIFFRKRFQIGVWLHELKSKRIHRFVYKNADFILATNSVILADFKKNILRKPYKTALTYNPISENQLHFALTKEDARKKINYSSQDKLIVYTGKLYKNQAEIEFVIEAAKKLKNMQFIFTGGKKDVLSFYNTRFKKENIQNIRLTGYLNDYSQIKFYQKAADLLISYYTESEHDVNYNFPNKICEYMLSGNPIITPFYTATKDVLNEANAFEVEAENSEKLALKIEQIFRDETKMKSKAENAFKTVQNMTYRKVVAQIIESLTSKNEN